MYDDLVKRLRELPHLLFVQLHGHEDTVYKAADAIEELSMKLHGDEAAILGMKSEIERMVVNGTYRWIPVTEKLPEKNGFYLCCYEAKNKGGVAVDEGLSIIQYLDGKWHLIDTYKVTHWIPIPEPPTGGEDDGNK